MTNLARGEVVKETLKFALFVWSLLIFAILALSL